LITAEDVDGEGMGEAIHQSVTRSRHILEALPVDRVNSFLCRSLDNRADGAKEFLGEERI
jgi:hypothetical protein